MAKKDILTKLVDGVFGAIGRGMREKAIQKIEREDPEEGKKIRLDPFDLIAGKNIKGSWGGGSQPDKDVKVLAELYNQGFMPLEKLITKTYSLEEINLALDDLKNSNAFRPLIVF